MNEWLNKKLFQPYWPDPSNLWEPKYLICVFYTLTPKVYYSALGRGTGGIQRQIYFFLQKTQLHPSFDAQFYVVQHLPNDSSLQAQVRTSCQENTAVISSTVLNKHVLAFQHICLYYPVHYTAWALQLERSVRSRYFNPYFSNSISDIWKKLHHLSSSIIYH